MRWRRLLAAVAIGLVGPLLAGLGALGGTAPVAAAAGPTVTVAQNATLGPILVGPNGLTLYYFKKDSANVSNCSGGCATIWPPLTVTGTPTAGAGLTGTLGTIQRSDGSTQVTYNGWPLYYYAADAAAGDTNGQGVLSVWYVAAPGLTAAAPAAATSTPAAGASSSSSASSSSTSSAASSSSSAPASATSSTTPSTTNATTVSVGTSATLGSILVGSNGMTLYYFKKDSNGVSNCAGKCASIWPALTVTGTPTAGAGVTGTLGTSKNASGATQVTYNGWPLYYYAADTKPGDTNGQGFLSVWYVASPTLTTAPAAAPAAPATAPAAATLPKTGGGPLPEALGGLLLAAGGALVLRRRSRRAA